MTAYQARWDHSPLEATALVTFARTILSVEPADLQSMPDLSMNLPPEAARASEEVLPARPSGATPSLDRLEPVLTGPDDFSDLIALADEGDDDPLLLRREPDTLECNPHESMQTFLAAGIDESDPLAPLVFEYRHALLSRNSSHSQEPCTMAETRGELLIKAPSDPFSALADPSQTEASVFDLLTKGKNVDSLLESLDAFGAEQIFKADEPHEILTLLAPRGVPAERASQTAQLTREEHHMVSVDSHMATPVSTEDEEPRFSDESNR